MAAAGLGPTTLPHRTCDESDCVHTPRGAYIPMLLEMYSRSVYTLIHVLCRTALRALARPTPPTALVSHLTSLC